MHRREPLIGEFDRLKNEPISERELQRTKNQFARDYILNRESDQEKARVLSHAVEKSEVTSASEAKMRGAQRMVESGVPCIADEPGSRPNSSAPAGM